MALPSKSEAFGNHDTPTPAYSHGRTQSFSPLNSSPTHAFDSTPPRLEHARTQSFSPLHSSSSVLSHNRGPSANNATNRNSSSNTFAPQFLKNDALRRASDQSDVPDSDVDFSGKRYVWLEDSGKAFVRGWVVEEIKHGCTLVECEDGSRREVSTSALEKVNPAKFDKVDDMAELTHLNEPSVIHNLHTRYQSDLIYTYSGLFLVAVNPYCPLPIYNNEYIKMYKGQSKEQTRPHIFAVADQAFRTLVEEGVNQSILVTGESGAGKTENTKKVIQYLTSVATSDTPRAGRSPSKQFSTLSQQILRANPILESFGNAQTVRNNNSSRFGKFIRIEFTRSGQVAGAFIDWYLLEKSRVVKLNSQERTYHIFYQLLQGADRRLKDQFFLTDMDVEDFAYTQAGNDSISGVSDKEEWSNLLEAFHVMNFSEQKQTAILKTIAAILHLGNVSVMKESTRADQACLTAKAKEAVGKACRLLGVQSEPFIEGLLHPKVKAGREWVEKVQTPEQVRLAIDALSKSIYERGFGDLITKINQQLDRSGLGGDDTKFIGVLDIAGFEIFEDNSFEQLCINYTNEKLQQFFNHHMFVLEQEEYAREQIQWEFIDFGKDLQPTIDLIELPNPIGIFSCLDEDSVMPKATDTSFTDKLHSLWDKKTPKYRPSRLTQGFVLTHYAAEVEYSTMGWLEKNKDPLNDNLTRLLAASNDKHVGSLFADCADESDDISSPRSRVKKGLFRTVAQRHKEQLSSLMGQLHQTRPHFVRCILPNHKKRPKQFNAPLVLDQLRCNGVLEGIRIVRTGFPNRIPFAEFRSRYEVLCRGMPRGYLEGRQAASIILDRLGLDKSLYRVGLTKVFFRAGVLAELEEQRDALIRKIMARFQSVARGFTQRRIANKCLYRAEATRIIQRNFNVYLDLQTNPWWRLFTRMKPLLGATRTAVEVKRRDERIRQLEGEMHKNSADRQRLEDERRRADAEAQRVQQTLEGERALALDKEEIFKRLQNRESELEEKLADATADQDNLEDQLDEMIDARKKAEEEVDLRRSQLEQAGAVITRLEKEKRAVQAELEQLQQRDGSQEKGRQELQQELERVQQRAHSDEQDRARLRREGEELRHRLENAAQSRQKLQHELDQLRRQVDLDRTSQANVHEENQKLRHQIESEGREWTNLQSEKEELRDSLQSTEEERDAVRSQLEQLRQHVDSEAHNQDDLHREIEQLHQDINTSAEERKHLEHTNKTLAAELAETKAHAEKVRQQQASTERELRNTQAELQELSERRRQEDQAEREPLLHELAELRARLDNESHKVAELNSNLNVHRGRANDYFGKLEQAEIAVGTASRALREMVNGSSAAPSASSTGMAATAFSPPAAATNVGTAGGSGALREMVNGVSPSTLASPMGGLSGGGLHRQESTTKGFL